MELVAFVEKFEISRGFSSLLDRCLSLVRSFFSIHGFWTDGWFRAFPSLSQWRRSPEFHPLYSNVPLINLLLHLGAAPNFDGYELVNGGILVNSILVVVERNYYIFGEVDH